MVDILDHLHPRIEFQVDHFIPELQENVMVCKAKTHSIMLGGDQLSVVKTRSALKIRSNSETPSFGLEGFIPSIEDWHSKLILVEVSYKA